MKASNEELFYYLLWTTETLMRPTWRNLNESFEHWAFRTGLGRRLQTLAAQKLIELHPAPDHFRVVRLTEQGRLLALGGRDPIARWARPWDGSWRLVLFDLPLHQRALRVRLWRQLRREGFGYLQNSVWITPDSLDTAKHAIADVRTGVESLVLIEGRPCGGESDADFVTGAWDFTTINTHYERHLAVLRERPAGAGGARLHAWSKREQAAWKQAVTSDPLLPRALLPPGYLGQKSWDARTAAFAQLAQSLPPTS